MFDFLKKNYEAGLERNLLNRGGALYGRSDDLVIKFNRYL